MSDHFMSVWINGYGAVRVEFPAELTTDTVGDLVARAVADTMDLVRPHLPEDAFHMALGRSQ